MFYKNEKTAVLIDGFSVYTTARALGFGVDWAKLRDEFARRGQLTRMYYFTMLFEDQNSEERSSHQPMRPVLDWLAYNGYTCIEKQFREYTNEDGRRRLKGNIYVDVTVVAMSLIGKIEHLVLATSDSAYTPLVEELKRNGIRVTILASRQSSNSVSDDLRRMADNFVELAELRPSIESKTPLSTQAQFAE